MDYSTRKPRILIIGAGFVNQGAFLMLASAAQQIRDRFGGQPVIEARLGTQRQRNELGLETLLGWQRFNFAPTGGKREFLRSLKDHSPFIFSSEIDAVFDASGFAFSDEWVLGNNLQRRAKYLNQWAEKVPLYLLPQAFGPFEQAAESGKLALESASLAYARDPDSFRFAREVVDNSSTIRSAPDFTIGLSGASKLNNDLEGLIGGVAIVPNWNILNRAPDESAKKSYVASLVSAAKISQSMGLQVYGLCHEGESDRKILQMVAGQVEDFRIISGLNGLESKGLLGTASYAISGRFHAIVSALSQGVPTVIHGWSHKYQWLASDFNATQLICNPYNDGETEVKVAEIIASKAELSDQIMTAKQPLIQESNRMWDEIEQDFLLKYRG